MAPGPLSAIITSLLLGIPPTPCPEGPAPVRAADVVRDPSACDPLSSAAPDDASRYADLEARTPKKVAEFRGGDAVVYISTGAAIVIVVVLLLLFL
jgi:hypothetical protein